MGQAREAPRHLWNMSGTCAIRLAHVRGMCVTCPGHVPGPGACPGHVRHMSGACASHVRGMRRRPGRSRNQLNEMIVSYFKNKGRQGLPLFKMRHDYNILVFAAAKTFELNLDVIHVGSSLLVLSFCMPPQTILARECRRAISRRQESFGLSCRSCRPPAV